MSREKEKPRGVASFTDAWIETYLLVLVKITALSRPSRTRGLKPMRLLGIPLEASSRPSRTRGLKRAQVAEQQQTISRVLHGRVD